jgi:DNA repair exonuclease SbcCD ATPase subunit
MDIQELQRMIAEKESRLSKDRASQNFLKEGLKQETKSLEAEKTKLERLDKVQGLFQKAAENTQKNLEVHISKLVTTALSAVFDSSYEFSLEFIKKRGKTEADLWLIRNGEKMKPIDSVGGGVLDVTSFALRIAFWALTKPTRPVFILDEPFKHLNSARMGKAMDMLKMLSEKLGLQIIMISHIKKLIDGADKKFDISIHNGISELG